MEALAVDPTSRRPTFTFFHLMTRPVVLPTTGLPMDPEAGVEQLVSASLAGPAA